MPDIPSPESALPTAELTSRAEPVIRKRILEDANLSSFRLTDESIPKNQSFLSPLGESRLAGMTFYKQLEHEFNYLEDTHRIEVDSPRTDFLNSYVQKMIKGSDCSRARVVIMNKGVEPQGFVYPDGTIFINQALINQLDSIDEILAVLAHEVNHLKLKTFGKKIGASSLEKIGVGWIHEMGSDLGTIRLLESCGINSNALSTAIEKISGNNRGIIHQTGNMRSSEVAAAHYGIHTDTSHIATKPIPKEWKADPNPTNIEIALETVSRNRFKRDLRLGDIYSRLHPADLYRVKDEYHFSSSTEDKLAFKNEVEQRLNKGQYSQEDIFLFCIEHNLTFDTPLPHILDKPEKIIPFFEKIQSPGAKTKTKKMQNEIFFIDEPISNRHLLRYVGENLYIDSEKNADRTTGIAVNESVVLQLIEMNENNNIHKNNKLQGIECLIVGYIKEAYINPAKTENRAIDTQGIKNFLQKVNDLGYQIDDKFIEIIKDTKYRSNILRDSAELLTDILTEKREFSFNEKVDFLLKSMRLNQEKDELYLSIKYLKLLRQDLDSKDLTDLERSNIIQDIIQKIADMPPLEEMMSYRTIFNGKANVFNLNYHEGTREAEFKSLQNNPKIPEEQSLNHRIRVFNLQIMTAVSLYSRDDNNFYRTVEKIMTDSKLEGELTPIELISLAAPLLTNMSYDEKDNVASGYFYMMTSSIPTEINYLGSMLVLPRNINEINNLPFIKSALSSLTIDGNTSIKSLYKFMNNLQDGLKHTLSSNISNGLFKDSPFSLIFLQDVREQFSRILSQEISREELPIFYDFIKDFLPKDPVTKRLLRKTMLDTLRSDISLAKKINFIKTNIDSIGPEGFIILGEQIETMSDYTLLRQVMHKEIENLLEGNLATTLAATADFATSQLSKEFDYILETSIGDPISSGYTSTDFARKWINIYIQKKYLVTPGLKRYLREENLFAVDEGGLSSFRSISDIFETLHDLSQGQRFAILWKAFQDKNGAFSSPANREILAEYTTKTLGLKDGFISQIVSILCKNGKGNVITPPLASSLSGYLFSGLQTDAIDIEALTNSTDGFQEQILSPEYAEEIVKLPTRELVAFGLPYQNYDDKMGFNTAQEVKNLYYQTYDRLEGMAKEQSSFELQKDNNTSVQEVKDLAIEALIRGIQSSGAVGVRSMQLAAQFDLGLSDVVVSRLSESFDSNPGVPKLFLWENLYEMQRKAQDGNETYAGVSAFLDKITIKEKLGGGSLYSTYAAVLHEPGQEDREIVIKSLNPNALMMIKTFYSVANDALEKMKTEHPESASLSSTIQTLIDLSQEWCIADIQDPSFEKDDDDFRPSISSFNAESGEEILSAPDRIFNHFLLKAEERAHGRTLNSVLQDSTIPTEQKREAVAIVLDFFKHQLKQGPITSTNDAGSNKKYHLLLSDPNPGNMMIGRSGEKTIGTVIDRSMYLKLTSKEMASIQKLFDGEYNEFSRDFFFAICEANKINFFNQIRLGKQMRSSLKKKLGGGDLSKADPIHLIQTAMQEFEMRSLTVPLNYRLAIKNVFALQALQKRFSEN